MLMDARLCTAPSRRLLEVPGTKVDIVFALKDYRSLRLRRGARHAQNQSFS